MRKLQAAAARPGNSDLILELCRMQRLYEDQIQFGNRMASAVAARTLAMVDQLIEDKATLETERRAWQAEKEALQAQVENATAASERAKTAVKKMKTRVMAQSYEHRELQREMELQQAPFEAHKAQAAVLAQQLHDAQQRQTAMRQQLTELRRQVQEIQIAPQPPAANVEAAVHAAPRRLEEPNDQRAVSMSGSEPEDQFERAPVATPVERTRLSHPIRSTKASVRRQLAIKQKIDDRKKAEDAERAKDIATGVIPARVPVPT